MAQDKPKPKKKKKTAVRSSKPLGSSPSMGPMAWVGAVVGSPRNTQRKKATPAEKAAFAKRSPAQKARAEALYKKVKASNAATAKKKKNIK
jgi:hypothetical protein